jgi:hypothetical protein
VLDLLDELEGGVGLPVRVVKPDYARFFLGADDYRVGRVVQWLAASQD